MLTTPRKFAFLHATCMRTMTLPLPQNGCFKNATSRHGHSSRGTIAKILHVACKVNWFYSMVWPAASCPCRFLGPISTHCHTSDAISFVVKKIGSYADSSITISIKERGTHLFFGGSENDQS